MTNIEIADLIEAFVSNDKNLNSRAWDYFTTVRSRDLDHELARLEVLRIERNNPPDIGGWWCSRLGADELRKLAEKLRGLESK